jgi:uncharacterized membrane protein YdbT with pleckstrin-like domain
MATRERNIASVDRNRSESIGSVLVDHADLRLVRLSYLLPLSLILIAVVSFVLPISDAAKIGIGYTTIGGTFLCLAYLIPYHGRLRKATYTVTSEYIEARTGTFEKRVRRVPLSYIRDVTHTQDFFQKLFGLSSIKVVATNGDSIALENISDGEQKREIIWDLVFSRSPHTGRLKN